MAQLKRHLILSAAAAAIALSPLAAKSALAAREPLAEKPAAVAVADSSSKTQETGRKVPWVPIAATAALLAGMLILVGTEPPKKEERGKWFRSSGL